MRHRQASIPAIRAAFNAASSIKELNAGNVWLAHGDSNDMHAARQDAPKAGRFSIAYPTRPMQPLDIGHRRA
jgi:spermidine/putrescine-binding protein